MPKLKGPLFSFDASASVGKTLTYRKKRGYTEASPYTKTPQPNTPAQITRKQNLVTADSFCYTYLQGLPQAFAWQKSATVQRYKAPGYHQAVANTCKALPLLDPASFATECRARDDWKVEFYMQNVRTGDPGTEAGDFVLWRGSTPYAMEPQNEYPIAAFVILSDSLGTEGEKVYVQLVKNGLLRSGLYEITLLEDAPMGLTVHDNVRIDGDLELVGHFLGVHGYVPRGDPALYDFGVGDLTTNGAWHVLDLSAIVPAGTIAVNMRADLVDNGVGQIFVMKPNGNVNSVNGFKLKILVANVDIYTTAILAVDGACCVQYLAANALWTAINLSVLGWFI